MSKGQGSHHDKGRSYCPVLKDLTVPEVRETREGHISFNQGAKST